MQIMPFVDWYPGRPHLAYTLDRLRPLAEYSLADTRES